MAEKALFVPLKRKHYEDFQAGIKTEEFRPYGARWNEKVCRVGRKVVLSLGYGRACRMKGVILGFEIRHEPTTTEAWADCYGATEPTTLAACIRIGNLVALAPRRNRKHRKPSSAKKTDESVIPEGIYCYRHTGRTRKHPVFGRLPVTCACPHWSVKTGADGCRIGKCAFLGITDKDDASGGLLWDQVKACGVNEGLEKEGAA